MTLKEALDLRGGDYIELRVGDVRALARVRGPKPVRLYPRQPGEFHIEVFFLASDRKGVIHTRDAADWHLHSRRKII
jgi:hypothetical protein